MINVGGYIGDSTRSEIEYALAHGKKVKYLEDTEGENENGKADGDYGLRRLGEG